MSGMSWPRWLCEPRGGTFLQRRFVESFALLNGPALYLQVLSKGSQIDVKEGVGEWISSAPIVCFSRSAGENPISKLFPAQRGPSGLASLSPPQPTPPGGACTPVRGNLYFTRRSPRGILSNKIGGIQCLKAALKGAEGLPRSSPRTAPCTSGSAANTACMWSGAYTGDDLAPNRKS